MHKVNKVQCDVINHISNIEHHTQVRIALQLHRRKIARVIVFSKSHL